MQDFQDNYPRLFALMILILSPILLFIWGVQDMADAHFWEDARDEFKSIFSAIRHGHSL